ncbi:MAG: hypothetical protein WCF88_00140 [Candidatus Acidiferrales bacterium]|jgi:hypothetical protein
MRFEKDFERRTLRLQFTSGEVIDAIIISVADLDDGDGFVYETIPRAAVAFWARFTDLEKYEVLEN